MSQQIIMSFSVPPSADDLLVIANEQLDLLPEELIEAFELCVLEPEDGAEVEHGVVDGPHGFVAVVEFEVGDDGVAGRGGTIVIVEV